MSSLKLSDPALAVDWFELACMAQRRGKLRRSSIEQWIGLAAPDFDSQAVRDATSDVLAEVNRRAARSGALYPFRTTLNGLELVSSDEETVLLYRFLALCTLVPRFRQNRNGFTPGTIFERITAPALAVFTGGEARTFADLPYAGVRARIRAVGKLLHVRSYEGNARRERKDHGLDVFAWRAFGDQRGAHPVLLCQCTLKRSHTDVLSKAREVEYGEWGGLLDLREGAITKVIAIPHAIEPDYPHWNELRKNSDLVLERTRILSLLASTDAPWQPLLASRSHVAAEFGRWAHRELMTP